PQVPGVCKGLETAFFEGHARSVQYFPQGQGRVQSVWFPWFTEWAFGCKFGCNHLEMQRE
ncbi:MAG: hypothetical protein OSA97_14875, partial [Nevskia sp.]|nr:hypothetical protein [Nevskia sp.]